VKAPNKKIMRQLLIFSSFLFCLLSCKTKQDKVTPDSSFQFLMTDTTNNFRAQLDLMDFNNRSKLENQIGLKELKNGTNNLEIRLWYDFSFSRSKELYVLRLQYTSCFLSYYRVFLRTRNYTDENRNRKWNPHKDPIVDSCVSKSVLIPATSYKSLHLDSIWLLQSQSALKIPAQISYSDCDSYIIEIADKKRFKYLRHHCAMSYFEITKLKEILTYLDFCARIRSLDMKFNNRFRLIKNKPPTYIEVW